MNLSIIIVNYNGKTFLPQCLDSIFQSKTQFSFEVIVIDNNSQDGSQEWLKQCPHPIVLHLSPSNLGFGKANNLGAKMAKGEVLWLLNNDTLVPEPTLETVLHFINATPNIGLVSPKLLNPDGSLQAQGSALMAWKYKSNTPQKMSFLCGASLFIKKQLFLEVGGFDEQYFFYNEDLDLCKTLVKKGFDLYYLPHATVTHFGGQSTQTLKPKARIEGYRGGLYFAYKHYPRWIFRAYRAVLWVDIGPKLLMYGLLSLFQKKYHETFQSYVSISKIIIFKRIFNS